MCVLGLGLRDTRPSQLWFDGPESVLRGDGRWTWSHRPQHSSFNVHSCAPTAPGRSAHLVPPSKGTPRQPGPRLAVTLAGRWPLQRRSRMQVPRHRRQLHAVMDKWSSTEYGVVFLNKALTKRSRPPQAVVAQTQAAWEISSTPVTAASHRTSDTSAQQFPTGGCRGRAPFICAILPQPAPVRTSASAAVFELGSSEARSDNLIAAAHLRRHLSLRPASKPISLT